MFGGYRDGANRYCSVQCLSYGNGIFCPRCVEATTDEGAPSTFSVNAFGTSWLGARDRCAACHSVVRRHVFVILLVPVVFFATYRVLCLEPTAHGHRFVGRRLRA